MVTNRRAGAAEKEKGKEQKEQDQINGMPQKSAAKPPTPLPPVKHMRPPSDFRDRAPRAVVTAVRARR